MGKSLVFFSLFFFEQKKKERKKIPYSIGRDLLLDRTHATQAPVNGYTVRFSEILTRDIKKIRFFVIVVIFQ